MLWIPTWINRLLDTSPKTVDEAKLLNETAYTQPALFAVEVLRAGNPGDS